jgi:hypothetical protein
LHLAISEQNVLRLRQSKVTRTLRGHSRSVEVDPLEKFSLAIANQSIAKAAPYSFWVSFVQGEFMT